MHRVFYITGLLAAVLGLMVVSGCAKKTATNMPSSRVAGTTERAGTATVTITDTGFEVAPATFGGNLVTLDIVNKTKATKTFTLAGVKGMKPTTIAPGKSAKLTITKSGANGYVLTWPKPAAPAKTGTTTTKKPAPAAKKPTTGTTKPPAKAPAKPMPPAGTKGK